MLLAEALWRSTIGKMLLAEALWRSTIGKTLLAGALWRKQLAAAAGTGSWRKQPAAANRQWPFDKASANCQFGKSSIRCHFGRVGPVAILADTFIKRSGRDKGTNKKAASRRVSKLAA